MPLLIEWLLLQIIHTLQRFLKISQRVLLAFLLLVLILYALLHLSSVQTWLVKQVASTLSTKLNTRVTIKKVDIALFNKMLLRGLVVEDRKKDTLLYAGTAKVNITDWFFLKDKATLKYIALDDAVINMNRKDSVWNYQFLIDYFISPTKKTGSKGIEFDLKELHLKNIYLNKEDEWIGQNMIASLKQLDLGMESVNFRKKQVYINDLVLDKPLFSQRNFKGNRPAENNLTTILEKIPVISAFKWNNSGWQIRVKNFSIDNGTFINEKHTLRAAYTDRFDGQHLLLSGLTGSIKNLFVNNDTLTADVLLAAKEKSGFEIKKLQSSMRFTPEIMEFNKLDLITNRSHLRDYYSMSYNVFGKDMSSFITSVVINANFQESELHSDDLAFFAPALKSWNRMFYLQGTAKGTVDNFIASGMKIRSGNTFVDGRIAMRGLPDIKSTFIDFTANDFRTTYNELTAIAPALKKVKKPQLSKLGNIRYKGNFTGFLNDFVAYGTIASNLGSITADINMKLPTQGVPGYSGKLSTRGFKLGQFINNPQLGTISLNGNINGKSFALATLNANFEGEIQQLEYNGYNYRNISIAGDFQKKLFTGHISINDPNLNIRSLDGTLSLSGKEMEFNADADLKYVNLKDLKIAKSNLILSGLFSLNFTGNNIDNFLGSARVYKARLQNDSTALSFDSLTLSSRILNDRKYLTLQSNEIDAEISGKFTILDLPNTFKFFLSRYYPTYIKKPSYAVSNQDFTFTIKTKEVEEYIKLFDNRLKGFNNASISGNLDLAGSILNINAEVPDFEYAGKKFSNVILTGTGNRDTLKADLAVDDIVISDSLHFPDTRLKITANNDVSLIHLRTSASKTLNDAELNASIQTLSDGIKINFFPSSFIVNDKKWQLSKDGELTIRKKYIDASEVRFVQGDQEIILSTELSEETDQTHIVAKLVKVNIGDFSPLLVKKPSLKGLLTGTATLRDPFGKPYIEFAGRTDSFSLDNKYIGAVNLDATANTNTGVVKFRVDSKDDAYIFNIDGIYNYKDSTGNAMDVNLLAERMNLSILEPYLKTIFSRMEGIAKTNLKLSGGGKNIYLTGDATIDSGSVKIAYTQCRYLFNNETLIFNKDEIDIGTIRLRDTLNNTGIISGKMYHSFFKRFSFDDIRFETSRMLLLNTTKKDNAQFYGNVTGNALMRLNGPVTNLQMDINGEPSELDSSHIFLPTGASKESNALDYIEFIQFGTEMDEVKSSEAANIFVNMNLTANPSCQIDVILDESTGDIIKGQGNGLINIRVGNKEPLSIRGRYDLTNGEYTFNFQTFLKKPFVLNRGSITWNGDPYLANIDIEAEYLAKNVDISGLRPDARVNVKEDVTILSHLTGSLKKPIIQFAFRLPEKSEIKRDYIAINKLADFQNDPDKMNKQVASLLLFNSFLFDEQDRQAGSNTIAIATNTVGGLMSSFLTNLFNKELERATNGVISTYIDISPTLSLQSAANQLQANVRAGLKILLSSRIQVLIGGNLDYNNPSASQLTRKGLITPDITIEWRLNRDGSLRVVGFNRTSADYTIGQRNRSGIQLSYRKDFDKLSDIFKSRKKLILQDSLRSEIEVIEISN
ncbi:MAG: translocation/assembly module TamB domain-containing protein [Ferruginibacter sp.]